MLGAFVVGLLFHSSFGSRMLTILDERLIVAAKEGNLDVAKAVLKEGADINALDVDSTTPIHWASFQSHEELVSHLLGAGALVNVPDVNGFTPLDSAAQKGSVGIVNLLLGAGANIEARDSQGGTALYAAAGKGHLAVVQSLLEAGADVESRFVATDDTALIFAADKGHHEVVAALIKAGANVDATNREGFFALYRAGLSGNSKAAKVLIEAGASLEMVLRGSGETPLMAAAFGGHTGTVKELIDGGVDVNAANIFGQTAMHKAPLQFDRVGVTKALVDGGGFANLEDNKANTPLHIASQFGMKNTIRFMLRVGADPELMNTDFLTPRDVICQCKEFVAFPASIQCSKGQCETPDDVQVIRELIDAVVQSGSVFGEKGG